MSRRGSRGYVLPLVAVAVALLSLALWAALRVHADQNRRLRLLREQLALETAAFTAEARIAHLALTEPIGRRAVVVGGARLEGGRMQAAVGSPRELVLDGRPYAAPTPRGTLVVRAQDEAGLLNLNSADDAALAGALIAVGVAEPQARRLGGALADFTDPDDLRRLNGAEAAEYRRARRPGPANRPLLEPAAAAAALGWTEALTPAQQGALFAMAAAAPPERALNLNTAPPAVLKAWLGLDDRAAALVVERREQQTLQSVADIAKLTGFTPRPDAAVGGLPSRRLRLTFRFQDGPSGRVYQSRLVVAPDGADRPFYWRRTAGPTGRPAATEGRDGDGGVERLPHSPALLAP